MSAAEFLPSTSLNEPLGRRAYVTAGLTLMAVKYAVDATLIYMATGITWTPIDYLVPLMSFVGAKVALFPSWLNLLLLAWTAPFVWLGVTLSVRRAHSAGISPWWVVAFFLPVLNYGFMLALSLLPERIGGTPAVAAATEARQRPPKVAMIAGATAGAALGLGVASFGVMILRDYGLSIFLGTPFMMGAVAGFVSRRLNDLQPLRSSVSAGITAAVLLSIMLMAVAVEGLVCIVMAAPIALPVVALGAVIGHRLAESDAPRPVGIGLMLLLLPAGSAIDASIDTAPERVVLSSVEIEAPPDRVWRHVVSFDEIQEKPGWYLQAGARVSDAGAHRRRGTRRRALLRVLDRRVS